MPPILRLCRMCLAPAFTSLASIAFAIPSNFEIDQLFSSADGTVQFVVIRDRGILDCDSGEQLWAGQTLTSRGPRPDNVYVFPTNLPTCRTSRRHMLIATQSFAALGVVAPDYVIPDHFVQIPDGTLDFAGVFVLNYKGLPSDGVTAIDGGGKPVPNLAANLAGQSASVNIPGTPAIATAVEYRHAGFDHYFVTAIADEIAKLDNGTFAGWTRTGESFKVYVVDGAGLAGVCRFFSTAFGPKSSHFYTPDATECGTVRANPNWLFEAVVFYATKADLAGGCPSGSQPVYRLYNNGQGAAPNHRYTTSLAVRSDTMARGWIPEGYGEVGVIMCAPL